MASKHSKGKRAKQKDLDEDLKTSKNRKKRKKKSQLESDEEKTKFRKIKKILLILFLIAIFILGIISFLAVNNWKKISSDMMSATSSQVYDSQGNVIAEIGSERKKINISYSQIPDNLKNAYIAIEDEKFFKHHGINIKRTIAAMGSYVFHKGQASFGGSTITQQLVKNLTGDNSNSITRKVKEWAMAFELECFYSKEQILETYFNIIYVGPNVYGVEAGARYYFDKSVQDLSIAECAYLAGLNHSPNSYNPFGDKDNSDKIEKRTKIVLSQMLDQKYISKEDYEKAVQEVEKGLKFKNGDIESSDDAYSYHTDALITEIIADLKEKKHTTEEFANNYLYYGGLKIYSTQDTSIQQSMEKEFEKDKYILKSKQEQGKTSQAAMIIINHTNGQVVGCVGGLGEKTKSRDYNRATMSLRQTGSASKPFAVLAPALAKRKITASTVYDDSETTFTNIDGTEYKPGDYDPYQGKITVRRAVESSQNIPFVKIIEEIKPKTSIKYMKKMGVKNLTEKDNNLALSLGGEQKGLTTLEMATCYSTIANNGEYIEPTFYTRICNKSGEDIVKTKQKTKKIFSKEVAYILKNLLTQPVKGANGTAPYCEIKGMDVAAKTGTTNENYDRWLCGFTNYYTAATWYGFDMNETINYEGKNPAGLLWSAVMKDIHSNLKGTAFEMPSGVKTATICSETGMIATDSCPNTYTEYYLFGTIPGKCTEHKGNSTTTNNSKNTTQKQQNTQVEEKNKTIENTVNSTRTNTVQENKKTENKTNTNSNSKNTTNTNKNTNSQNTSKNTTKENTSGKNTSNTTEKRSNTVSETIE